MRRQRTGFGVLVVFVVACICAANTVNHGFTCDDHVVVERNSLVRDIERLPRVFDSPYWNPVVAVVPSFEEAFGLYRPLTIATYAVNWAVAGGSPFSFHLFNVLIHGLVCSLVFLVLRTWLATHGSRARTALWAGLFFAVHPIHTEVVGGVVGRAEILAALFVLACLLTRAVAIGARTAGRRLVLSSLSLVLFGFAILSKENALCAIGLALVQEALVGKRRGNRWGAVVYVSALGLVAIGVWGGMRVPVTGHWAPIPSSDLTNPIAFAPFLARFGGAVEGIGRAWGLLAFPFSLSADYSFAEVVATPNFSPFKAMMLLLVSVATVGGIAFYRHRSAPSSRGLFVVLAWFAISYAPVSNVLIPIGTVFAERHLYLPSVSGCLLVALIVTRCIRRERLVVGWAACTAMFGLGLTHVERSHVWKDDGALYGAVYADAPRSARACYLAGNHGLRAGWPHEECLDRLRDALWIRPTYRPPRSVLASALVGLGRFEEAERHYRALRWLAPRSVEALLGLAKIAFQIGDDPTAERELREALRVSTRQGRVHYELGRVLVRRGRADLLGAVAEHSLGIGRLEEAILHFGLAIELTPSLLAARYDRGVAHELLGRPGVAERDYNAVREEILRLRRRGVWSDALGELRRRLEESSATGR